MDKGKGRASDAPESSTYFDAASIDEDDSHTTADYESALESALYDESNSSTYRLGHGANGAGQQENDEEEEFVYDGQDDEDMKVFREDAKLDSLDYKDRLRNALGDASEVEEYGDATTTEVRPFIQQAASLKILTISIALGPRHAQETVLYRR